jgi:N6-adenosine-specific RNA methylase IME4
MNKVVPIKRNAALLPALPAQGDPISAEEMLQMEANLIAALPSVDDIGEADEWRRKAKAIESYLRSPELQRPALGAQRHIEARIGQLLGPERQGERTDLQPLHHDVEVAKSLINNADGTSFRLLGRALSGDCELTLDEWRKSRRALVSLVRRKLGLVPPLPVLPDGIFRCIVADPPWQLDTGPDTWGGTGERGHDSLAYEQMSLDDIKSMDVKSHAADDAHLYLWTTSKYLEHSYEVARAWGFEPSVMLVWCKTPRGVGLGDAFRLTTEFILYARRGSLKELTICDRTWFTWKRGRHSQKPEDFYQLVEMMTPAPGLKQDRLELFARKKRAGWTVWGDEIDSAL